MSEPSPSSADPSVDLCGEPHPDLPMVLCTKPKPCWGEHWNEPLWDEVEKATKRGDWDGTPYPGRSSTTIKTELVKMAAHVKPAETAGSATYPVLTYPSGSGNSGTSASKDREAYLDRSGKTAERQRICIERLTRAGYRGETLAEIRDNEPRFADLHNGEVSPALSLLNDAGYVALLLEKRGRNHVYVLPEQVGDRPLAPRKKKQKPKAPEPEPAPAVRRPRVLPDGREID